MQLIAHRGGAALRVENTLAAFEHAVECGVDGAELDVHLSRDGEVVVHHDDTLNPAYCRRAGGDWITPAEALPLSALTYAQMQAYDIGTPRPGTEYARRFDRIRPVPGQRIPLLRDVVRLAQAHSKRFLLVVEIKTPLLVASRKPWVPLVEAVLEILREERFVERSILCSFDWGSLRHARARCPDLPAWFTTSPLSWFGAGTPPASDIPPDPDHLQALREGWSGGDAPWFAGFDPRRFGGRHARAIAAAGGQAWFPWHRDFTPQAAHELGDQGLAGAVWSVNLRDPVELARLAHCGVDHLVVDDPVWARQEMDPETSSTHGQPTQGGHCPPRKGSGRRAVPALRGMGLPVNRRP